MPQVWLTYDELGTWLACGETCAAQFVASAGWPRRRCSDGLSRAKLPKSAMDAFLRGAAAGGGPLENAADTMVASLRSVLDQAGVEPQAAAALRRSSASR